MKKRKDGNAGFTLVDVICAVTIIMLVALPIFTGFIMAAKTNNEINDKLDINLVLQNELELIKSTGKLEDAKYEGNPVTVEFAKGVYQGNDGNGVTCPMGEYTKTVSELDLIYNVTQKKVDVDGNNSIAYYVITITYQNKTPDDQSDDFVVKGVYSPW